ncbi:MAG: adenine specific methylase Mod [Ignavibacteria bacterium]|nr:adenine specific methylase Mod [Ignavibacteria bacterium]
MKQLFFGDCYDVLRDLNRKNPNGFIDLIYIDPPFNSKRDYNILFENIDMTDTKAQKQAFADTWSNVSYKDALNEILIHKKDLFTFLKTLDNIHFPKSSIAYLTTMALRIFYMYEALKSTGSFYLHCDPNMSHYLKIVCDLIFGKENFRNEIVWCYKARHFSKKNFGPKHDVILRYSKSDNYTFNWQKVLRPLSETTVKKFKYHDEIGNYRLVGRGIKGSPIQSAKDVDIKWETEHPELVKRNYVKEGVPYEDYWYIDLINQAAKERLGYPTQKPESLLERIIKASSNEGDLVADFFCGCGTTIAVAEKLGRNWVGADISHLAIRLILKRLTDPYEDFKKKELIKNIEINGFPRDSASAKELAETKDKGRIKFQDWVVEVLIGGISNEVRTADGGWDGYLTFPTSDKEYGIVLIEVKSGNVNIKNVREFIQVVNKNNSDIGVFVCFSDTITKPMLEAAKDVGKFKSYNFDKLQIISIEELLEGKEIKLPGGVSNSTFKSSTRKLDKEPDTVHLFNHKEKLKK